MGYAVRKDERGWRVVTGVEDIGPDETYSETQPVPYAETDAGKTAMRKEEIGVALAALDVSSARPLRAILAAQAAGETAAAADVARLAELEAQAVTLRKELASIS
jgi:hypothetical protein